MSPRLLASMLALCRMDIRARTSFGRVAVSSFIVHAPDGSTCRSMAEAWRHAAGGSTGSLVSPSAAQRRARASRSASFLRRATPRTPAVAAPSVAGVAGGLRLLFLHLPFFHLHRRRRWRRRLQHLRPAHFLLHCKESTWRTPSSNVTGLRLGGCRCGACRWVAWPIGMSAHFTPLELARRTS